MFVTQKTLTTTTTTSSSSLGGYRGKEVVQKSRSSMRSKRNVVVRAEAQKTIDMNEVSFTLIDSFNCFCCAFVSSLSLLRDGKGVHFSSLSSSVDPSSRRRMGRKISSSKWIKYQTFEITFYTHTRHVLLTKSQLLSLSLSSDNSLARITFASRTRILCSTTKTTNTSRKSWENEEDFTERLRNCKTFGSSRTQHFWTPCRK